MKWGRRYRARLKRALRELAGQPVGSVQLCDPSWSGSLLFQENRSVLNVQLAVDNELLHLEYLGSIDRLVGEAASREAIRCVRERCRA